MSAAVAAGAGTLDETLAARALSPEPDGSLARAMEILRDAAGNELEAVVFFGSRRTGAENANRFSAYDLVAVVRSYGPFYRGLRFAGLTGKSPRLLSQLSRWLPPTQISLRFPPGDLHAKVSVIELPAFLRETSPRRRDHFTIGRLFQPVRLVFARGDEARESVLRALVSAQRETWRWLRPWLPASFDAEAYGRCALAVSMSWEIRPEPAGRAEALWSAQRGEQLAVVAALLEELAAQGELRRADGGVFSAVRSTTRRERLRLRVYFTISIVRATARWAKHMLSFEGWLDYIVRKASRHSGVSIQLSARERRWPLVFLWGRVLRFLRHKGGGGSRS